MKGMTGRKGLGMLALVLASAVLLGASGYRPKCRYAFGGAWVGTSPENPGVFFYARESPDDIVGNREATLEIRDQNFDVTFGGAFPQVVDFTDALCRVQSTGRDTFRYNSLRWGLDANNQVQWIMITGGVGRWIDADHRRWDEMKGYLFLPFQDADSDGMPDDGQEPVMSAVYTVEMERMPFFPEWDVAPPPG